jgi:hypothetical protein
MTFNSFPVINAIVMAMALDPNKINKSLFLQGASSFAQFSIQGRLLTVIGEVHLMAYKPCGSSPATTVAEYIVSSIKNSSGSRILMEYVPGLEEMISLIGSKNMADTFRMLKDATLTSHMTGFDIRSTFLRPKDQDVLYHEWKLIEGLPEETVAGVFVNAIPAAVVPSLQPNPKVIKNKEDLVYLQSFLDDMNNHAAYTLAAMKEWSLSQQSRAKAIRMIQDIWKKVSDYALVKEILTPTKEGSIVVLCGEQHALNLASIFSNPLFRVIIKNKDDCLNLRNSFLRL